MTMAESTTVWTCNVAACSLHAQGSFENWWFVKRREAE